MGKFGLFVQFVQASLVSVVVVTEELVLVVITEGNKRLLGHIKVEQAALKHVVLVHLLWQRFQSKLNVDLVDLGAAVVLQDEALQEVVDQLDLFVIEPCTRVVVLRVILLFLVVIALLFVHLFLDLALENLLFIIVYKAFELLFSLFLVFVFVVIIDLQMHISEELVDEFDSEKRVGIFGVFLILVFRFDVLF